MHVLLVSIGVAALALLLVLLPAIALQFALRLFAAHRRASDTSMMCPEIERTRLRPLEVAPRPLELSRSSS